MPADTVAPEIKRARRREIARLDVEARAPRPSAAEHRASCAPRWSSVPQQWKADLRAEPKVARLLLRRLVGPLTLWDEAEGGVRWDAPSRRRRCWMGSVHTWWRPQRDSNPCFGLERATSWASGRWGRSGAARWVTRTQNSNTRHAAGRPDGAPGSRRLNGWPSGSAVRPDSEMLDVESCANSSRNELSERSGAGHSGRGSRRTVSSRTTAGRKCETGWRQFVNGPRQPCGRISGLPTCAKEPASS